MLFINLIQTLSRLKDKMLSLQKTTESEIGFLFDFFFAIEVLEVSNQSRKVGFFLWFLLD